jgi:hypothetical protein
LPCVYPGKIKLCVRSIGHHVEGGTDLPRMSDWRTDFIDD